VTGRAGRAVASRVALGALSGASLACDRVAPLGADGDLTVSPASVACTAGDAVALEATVGGRRAPASFTVAGDGAWLTDVRRDQGTASVACEAEGRGDVFVEAAGRRATVPVVVAPAPAAGVRVSVAPASIALVSGTTAWIDGRAVVARPGASDGVRYRSLDTTVAAVDSVFGLVRATGPGATSVLAEARANRAVRAAASVAVVRTGTLVVAIFPNVSALTLGLGDSARVTAGLQLAPGAPPATSRALVFTTTDPSVAVVSPTGWVRAVGQGVGSVLIAPAVAPLLRTRVVVTVSVPAP
jgi:hypothetical protein